MNNGLSLNSFACLIKILVYSKCIKHMKSNLVNVIELSKQLGLETLTEKDLQPVLSKVLAFITKNTNTYRLLYLCKYVFYLALLFIISDSTTFASIAVDK